MLSNEKKETDTMKNLVSIALVFIMALTIVSFAGEKKVEIKIDGMTCTGCVNKVKTSLEKADGVKSAEFSLKNSSAVILYDDSRTDESSLKKAINSTGFKAVDMKAAGKKNDACCDDTGKDCAEKK